MATSLSSRQTPFGTEIGFFETKELSRSTVNLIRRMTESLNRCVLKLKFVKFNIAKTNTQAYTQEMVGDIIESLRLKFPMEFLNDDVMADIDVKNETTSIMYVTTDHMTFMVNGRISDWKPKHKKDILELRPGESVQLKASMIKGCGFDSAIYKIALVHPVFSKDDKTCTLVYRSEYSMNTKDIVLSTLSAAAETFQNLKERFEKEDQLDCDDRRVDMSDYDMSISYQIQDVSDRYKDIAVVAVSPDPEPPNEIIMRIQTRSETGVRKALVQLCKDLHDKYEKLFKSAQKLKIKK